MKMDTIRIYNLLLFITTRIRKLKKLTECKSLLLYFMNPMHAILNKQPFDWSSL